MLHAKICPPAGKVSSPLFFPVSPFLLFPGVQANFRVYLRRNGKYVLYTREEERFLERHKHILNDMGVHSVYVLSEQKEAYETYLEQNLEAFLANEAIPGEQRAKIFHDLSLDIVEDIFDRCLPADTARAMYDRIHTLVRSSVKFLSRNSTLGHFSRLISHTYKTYTHSMHVFVYATAIYASLGLDEKAMVRYGLGALLHDIGKARIDKALLDKPGKLSEEEWTHMRLHPVHGAAMCAAMPLSGDTLNCIILHHERFDGSGYPSGLQGEAIPLPVRVVTVCDVYDALTSDRPYASAVAPFEALSIMREQMSGHFDKDIFRRLVLALSGAKIV